jgi:nanoRNase/pAp phosphatase (c-di-AMP/oligoRNAs hydrolase)
MMTDQQQIKELIDKSKNILVVTKKFFNGDDLGSALAWFLFLKKLNKNVEIAIDQFQIPAELNFLSETSIVKKELTHLKKSVITLDITQTGLEELSYDLVDKELKIFITPKRGELRLDDLKIDSASYRFDLIIVLGCSELESLEKIYNDHPNFYFKTPIINLDHQGQNDRFGQINLVELNKTSLAEITFQLFSDLNQILIDEKIATCLLTGLIVATGGFKNPRLTPESLNAASSLITLGANKEQIITNLYRNKSIITINLWGKILSRVKAEENNKVIWSQISRNDLPAVDLPDNTFISILEELLSSVQQAEIVFLFVEEAAGVKIFLYNRNQNINLLPFIGQFNGQGDKKQIIFRLTEPMDAAIDKFLSSLKIFLSSINN